MTSSDDKSTCKYINFRPISDSKPESKIPIYGYLLFEDECPVESHTFPLYCTDFTIGREKGSHLRVMTPIASRVHCVINYEKDDTPTLINKSSLNKTCVNDVMVNSSVRLIDGASIKVGQHVFKYKAIETTSGQEDTMACESTLEENIDGEQQDKSESKHHAQEIEEHEEKIKILNGKNGRKVNGKKVGKKVEKPKEEPTDEYSEHSDEHEGEQGNRHESGNESDESDIAAPLSVSDEKSENEDAPFSAVEEKGEDDDAIEEKLNDEASSPLKLKSKNNLKVTFKPGKETKKTQKSQSIASDAVVRRSTRRRQNASEPTSEPVEGEPEEPKKVKTTRKAFGSRRKKTVNEEEEDEPTKEVGEKVQEENKRPRRGRKAKVDEVSEETTASKPVPTRRTRSRK